MQIHFFVLSSLPSIRPSDHSFPSPSLLPSSLFPSTLNLPFPFTSSLPLISSLIASPSLPFPFFFPFPSLLPFFPSPAPSLLPSSLLYLTVPYLTLPYLT